MIPTTCSLRMCVWLLYVSTVSCNNWNTPHKDIVATYDFIFVIGWWIYISSVSDYRYVMAACLLMIMAHEVLCGFVIGLFEFTWFDYYFITCIVMCRVHRHSDNESDKIPCPDVELEEAFGICDRQSFCLGCTENFLRCDNNLRNNTNIAKTFDFMLIIRRYLAIFPLLKFCYRVIYSSRINLSYVSRVEPGNAILDHAWQFLYGKGYGNSLLGYAMFSVAIHVHNRIQKINVPWSLSKINQNELGFSNKS